jgi:hypothetical protein
MILFGKKYAVMDEMALEGGAGGGGPAAGAEGAAAPEFTASMALNSVTETPEDKANAAAVAALANEASGWVDPGKGSVSYEKTGDAALDVALDFVARAGFSHSHPAVIAAASGDFGLLAAALAEKGVAGWEQHLGLAKEAYGRFQGQAAEKNAQIKAACLHATDGDEQMWADTLAWGSANAEPHEKEQVNAALAAGGIQAEAMAAYLVSQYRSASGVTYNPTAKAVNANAAGAGAGAGTYALSPAQYSAEVAKLRQGGRQVDGSPEYKALQQRRAAFRG